MVSVCVLSAAWRRFEVTQLVLRQRQRLTEELAARGVDAVNLVVADDENLDIAAGHGCETLEAPNRPLGQKCNLGLHRAAGIADFVCWVGSDDWIHSDVFDILPALDLEAGHPIIHGRRLQVVNLAAGTMRPVDSPSQYGAIPWLIDSRLIRPRPPLPPQLESGLDGALVRGIRRALIPFQWVFDDPHPFRCVDFKTSENITPYEVLARRNGDGPEEVNPWGALRDWFPADLVEQARRLHEQGGTR